MAASMPANGRPTRFALFRHSAYAVAGNADFEQAVELRELTAEQVDVARRAGGAVYDGYAAAKAAEQAANFPTGNHTSPPRAPGYFSSVRIGGVELYLPQAAPETLSRPKR